VPQNPPPSSQQPARPTAASKSAASSKGGPNAEEYSIDDLLKLIVEKQGSDLHLTVGSPPMLRLQGKLWPTDLPVLSAKDTRRLIFQFLDNDQRARLEEHLELDISYELEDVARFRCNLFYTRLGMGAVFRVIPTEIKSLAELKLPPVLGSFLLSHRCKIKSLWPL
jgi:twitching motility protein PilT